MSLEKILERTDKISGNYLKALGIMLALYTSSIPVTYVINRNIKTQNQTVVFTSGNDSLLIPNSFKAKVIDFFMYTPITLRQNKGGKTVTWVSNASKEEVLDYLKNPEYQNVVFIGHGNGYLFVASDGRITAEDIISQHIPQKNGELIEHTCGGFQNLRIALLKNPDKGYQFNSAITMQINYFIAWKKLFE